MIPGAGYRPTLRMNHETTHRMSDDDARERAEQRTLLMPRREQGAELRAGHQMQEFVVERLLGVGGYSVVYLARDTKLDRKVALKEYLETYDVPFALGQVIRPATFNRIIEKVGDVELPSYRGDIINGRPKIRG